MTLSTEKGALHLHIDDLAELYLRTLADAPPGSLYFAESGEASWRDMAIGIGRAVGLSGEPEALPTEEALRLLGIGAVTSFGSNSRAPRKRGGCSAGSRRRPASGTILGRITTGPRLLAWTKANDRRAGP